MSIGSDIPFIRTKIIATLGPASSSREQLEAMFDAGLDVCRLNFSHGDLDDHRQTLETVRAIAEERNEATCVVGDLCGPKIRLGDFETGPVKVARGDMVRFVRGDGPCGPEQLTISYPALIDEVAEGERIYVNDGLVRLVVRESRTDELLCECLTAGVLKSHKGVNLPDTRLSTPALTEKDRRDLEWAIEHDLDYVALSFVRRPEDLYELKGLIKERGSAVRVIIKIEKPEALQHLDELIANTDAVLVARGDLGVETDIWRVPLVQKDIVARCRAAGVPVIVATQMLESMISSPMPTRAEVSDVANAILDRTDALMLSGETAVGQYPIESLDMMNRVAGATEDHLARFKLRPEAPHVSQSATEAVAQAAVSAALNIGARVVAVWSATGTTARMVARHRLRMPIIGLTYDPRARRQMNLLFGVLPLCIEPLDHPTKMAAALDTQLRERKLAYPGDLIVVVSSTMPTVTGASDTVLVHRVCET